MRPTRLILMTALLCGALPSLAWARGDALSRGEITLKTQDVKGSDTPRVIVKAVVDAPMEKVWRLIEDCANYKRYFDNIASSKLLKREGDQFICEVEVSLPFPFSNLVGVTRATHTITPTKRSRSWTLIRGDYKANTGSWVLEPYGEGGTRTLATYTVHADPTTSVPDWLRVKAQKKSLPGMMERLRKETKKLK